MASAEKPLPDRIVSILSLLHSRKLNDLIANNALGSYEEREQAAGRFVRLFAGLYRHGGLCDEDLEIAATLDIDKAERLLKYRAARRLHGDEFEKLDPSMQEAWKQL